MDTRSGFGRCGAAFAASALLLTLLSCATAKMSDMWRDPSYSAGPLKNVLVVAVIKNDAQRRLWEDAFATELGERGVKAVQSYQLFGGALPDTAQVVNAVGERGLDGVLAVHPLRPDTTLRYVPGYVLTRPRVVYSRWVATYDHYYRDIQRSGYVEIDRHVRHQLDVWSTKDEDGLVWTATSDVVDPDSNKEVREKVVDKVVEELADQRIIP